LNEGRESQANASAKRICGAVDDWGRDVARATKDRLKFGARSVIFGLWEKREVDK